jgi:hypothetical protein
MGEGNTDGFASMGGSQKAVPKKLTRDQRRLFEELPQHPSAENSPHGATVFDKAKNLFH